MKVKVFIWTPSPYRGAVHTNFVLINYTIMEERNKLLFLSVRMKMNIILYNNKTLEIPWLDRNLRCFMIQWLRRLILTRFLIFQTNCINENDVFNIEGQWLNFELNWKEFEGKFLVWLEKVGYMRISYLGSGWIEKEYESKKICLENFT